MGIPEVGRIGAMRSESLAEDGPSVQASRTRIALVTRGPRAL
jgi:hypothetical protein